MSLRRTFLAASLAFAARPSLAQADSAPRPAFEVATIRPAGANDRTPTGFVSYPGGRVTEGSVPIRHLIADAYNLPDHQIAGGPTWIDTELYTVVALPPDSSPSRTAKTPPV